MQTFLPYSSFKASAKVLDRQRLGKQRVECLQILNVLFGVKSSWANHPAVLMWKGYEGALIEYSLTICEEWTSRGYKDTCAAKIFNL
ncbi:MSMEG_6728 family protein, partial [Klebsiella pneumoniae]|uniref:MSMEG_6728 family protein n=1 Tax=Klebsiella pneumoniae TaxID=573 RepID=UPI003854349A